MTRMLKIALGLAAVSLTAPLATTAYAQQGPNQQTPKNFNWEIKDGKRVPKGDRQVNADGSWREEIRQGKCVVVKEKSSAGEYKESRKCD